MPVIADLVFTMTSKLHLGWRMIFFRGASTYNSGSGPINVISAKMSEQKILMFFIFKICIIVVNRKKKNTEKSGICVEILFNM